MKLIFRWYALIFPYILFLNIFSFGSNKIGIGTISFVVLMFILLVINLLFFSKISVNRLIFFGLSSFLVIQIIKIFTYNVGDISGSSFVGYLGNWLFFLLNFIFSSVFLKGNFNKVGFIKMLSNSFFITSLVGLIHYYLFFNISFMDPSYGSDEFGTIFNVADYDLMRFRESSIFFGPNVNAYMSVFGYLCMIFSIIDKGVLNVFKTFKFWIFSIIHICNILVSDSRSGFLLIIILTILIINEKGLNIGRVSSTIKSIFIFLLLIILSVYTYNQPRFSFETLLQDGRLIKIITGIEIFFSSKVNILFGTPINFVWTLGDVSVSDNMYIAILLYVGLIGFIILAYTFLRIIKKLNYLINKRQELIYNLFAKYFLILILFAGFFSIPIAMMPPMVYLGIILGGVEFNSQP